MKNYKYGLCSVSFRKNTPEEIVAAMVDAGLEYIEWGSDVHAPKDDIENLKYLVKLTEQKGIKISSYGTYFRIGTTPTEELYEYIKAARVLGTDILRVWCGDKNFEEYTDAQKEEFYSLCRECAEIAEREGVTLCMECHNNTLTNDVSGSLELMQKINSKNFLMYWQPNQKRDLEYNVSCAEKLCEYVVNVHTMHYNEDVKQVSLEEGIGAWRKYLEKLGEGKLLLLEFMPDGRIESLKGQAAALKSI